VVVGSLGLGLGLWMLSACNQPQPRETVLAGC
jgi:hypothetical protein